jgi:hypothetical protein
MSWSYNSARTAWVCTNYSDLNYAQINNLAEYGQPFSPYERGYVHGHVPDFGNVNIDMTQQEVMNSGYGKDITAKSFPVVEKFLAARDTWPVVGGLLAGSGPLPQGSLTFQDLVARRFAAAGDRFIGGTLYPWSWGHLPAGSIDAGDAAYIHGTVGFALMAGTRFINASGGRRVEAEIGALDDNWDFDSGNGVAQRLNGLVAVLLGPDHYNLTREIRIRFTGPGKRSAAS